MCSLLNVSDESDTEMNELILKIDKVKLSSVTPVPGLQPEVRNLIRRKVKHQKYDVSLFTLRCSLYRVCGLVHSFQCM